MLNRLKKLFKSNSINQSWKVLVKKTDKIDFDFSKNNIEIKNTFRYWYADPFLIKYNKKVFLFVEVFDKFLNKGSIGYFDLEKNPSKHKIVLQKKYHLSYPFIFTSNDEYYMVPESSEINEVSIYKATNFPGEWKKFCVILDNVNAVDTNLIRFNNKIFLISGIVKKNSNVVEEVIYELNENFSVVKLISKKDQVDYGSRNAGDFWVNKDKIYRFTQDCSNDNYGTGVIKSEFTPHTNSMKEYLSYKEILYLNNSHTGFHTISFKHGYLAVDVKYEKRNNLIIKIYISFLSLIKSLKRRFLK